MYASSNLFGSRQNPFCILLKIFAKTSFYPFLFSNNSPMRQICSLPCPHFPIPKSLHLNLLTFRQSNRIFYFFLYNTTESGSMTLELAEIYGRLSCFGSESSGLYDNWNLLRTIRYRGGPYCLSCCKRLFLRRSCCRSCYRSCYGSC